MSRRAIAQGMLGRKKERQLGTGDLTRRPAGTFEQMGRHMSTSALQADHLSAACRKGKHSACTSLYCQCSFCHPPLR